MSLEPVGQLQVAEAAGPSSKALGKRRLGDDQQPLVAAASGAAPPQQPTLAHAVQKRERRVTRSSRGQATADPNSPGNSNDGEGHAQPRYLPARTRIRLVSRQPRNVVPFQTIAAQHSASSLTAAAAATLTSDCSTSGGSEQRDKVGEQASTEKPLFRLLDETELLPPRGTRHAAAEIDTSDAFYHRLHRYPEVLEKRAARLERERLIHERSKLINELEELRGRTWVYAGTSAGGRAEAERQKRIKAMGEKLARYDALLPNQPRKSNFLNLAGAGAVPGPSNPAANAVARDTRTASPSLHAPIPSRQRPATSSGSHATSRPAEPNPNALPHGRPSTPVSAASVPDSNGNKTTIRIKFGPPPTTTISTTTTANNKNHSSSSSSARRDGGYDLDRYTVKGELRKGPKRDRKAERERAAERRKLGLKPRSSIDKATAQLQVRAGMATTAVGTKVLPPNRSPAKRVRRSSRAGVSYAETDDDEDDEDQLDEDEDEDATMANGTGDDANAGRQATSKTKINAATASSSCANLVRKRLPDSFFQSAALRDAVMASHQGPANGPNGSNDGPQRRASSRVSYAFGQRLPDRALVRQVEFEPHGGVSNDAWDDEEGHTRTTLEEMVRLRMERLGEEAVVLGGHVLPKSAVDAWSKDPLHVSPLTAYQALHPNNALEASSTAEGSSHAAAAAATPLPPAQPEPVAADSPSRAVSPELMVEPSPHATTPGATWANPKPVAS